MTVLKRSVQLSMLILLTMSVSFGWSSLKKGEIFPIVVVKVEAEYTHLSPDALEYIISSYLPTSFWTIDTNALEMHLKTLIWVQSVEIEKVWPNTIKIQINEKKVLARWGGKGLLSDREEIFYPNVPSEIDESLPILYGPEGKTKVLLEQYNTITRMLQTKNLIGKMLLMSESGAWFLRLSNGTLLLLGSEQPIKRLTRFLDVYEVIFKKSFKEGRVARRVDLRYPHGMAVSWVNDPAKQKK